MKNIEFAVCPVGSAAGHDADELRANRFPDGSIVCVSCATSYPSMSPKMLKVWRTLAGHYGTPTVQLGSLTDPGTREYDASCLCGYDPLQSDNVKASFKKKETTVVLQYDRHHENELDTASVAAGRDLTEDERIMLSPEMRDCIKSLEELGFRAKHFGCEWNGMRIVMSAGRPVGTMGYVVGAHIELRYNAR